jgi:hypothetical protein
MARRSAVPPRVDLIDLGMEIGGCFAALLEVRLEVIEADAAHSERPSEANIRSTNVVRYREIPLVPELLIEATDHSFV